MKFIRKNGRIIPIKDKVGGSSGAGYKKPAAGKPKAKIMGKKKKSYPKVSSFGVLPGAAVGAAIGFGYGKLINALPGKGKVAVGLAAGLGGFLGAAGGSLSKTKIAKGESPKHAMNRVTKSKVKWF